MSCTHLYAHIDARETGILPAQDVARDPAERTNAAFAFHTDRLNNDCFQVLCHMIVCQQRRPHINRRFFVAKPTSQLTAYISAVSIYSTKFNLHNKISIKNHRVCIGTKN